MSIPVYPDFIPLSLNLRGEIHPLLELAIDGISEFTFSNLYLFRNRYKYRVARLPGTGLILSGITPEYDSAFFMTPCGYPGNDILKHLFATHNYWKNIPPSLLDSSIGETPFRRQLEEQGVAICEDRDNFDYLYLRSDLAALSGKKFHKKKNLVNAFMNAWPDHEGRRMDAALIPDALAVLERWKKEKNEDGDYFPAREALELYQELNLYGSVYYVNKRPVAYCLGESIGRDVFAIHFEKALDSYKGVFQYMNQAFTANLPEKYTLINREQDLGNEGLRQAKMTYRPVGFVKKYKGVMHG